MSGVDIQVVDSVADVDVDDAALVAAAFHYYYEHLAPSFEYETRRESRVEWSEVPEVNRSLMIAVVKGLIDDGVIDLGPCWGEYASRLTSASIVFGEEASGGLLND